MIVEGPSGLRSRETSRSGAFAITGAALIRQLSIRHSGEELRKRLDVMSAHLQHGGVTVELAGGRLLANDVPVPQGPAADWILPLDAAGVAAVTFDQGATARELLLFFALLVAPGDASAFSSTWLANGAWRIHVTTAGVSAPVADTPLASDGAAHPLEHLCAAVARGEAVTPGSSLHSALRAQGPAATEALLEALTRSITGSQRRLFFDAIVAVGEGSEHLLTALRHEDWRVVRNAVALLGELKLERAIPQLASACAHEDYRVRMAAATSLGQLDSPNAQHALLALVNDAHAQVRARAWTSLSLGTEAPPAPLFDVALRRPDHEAVQHAMLTCAAAFPSLDIAAGLVRFCAREFSQHGPRELLVFAVEQLALRRPESAKSFVSRLPERLSNSA